MLGTLPGAFCELICLLPIITPGDRQATDREIEAQREEHLFKVTG